MAYSKIVWENEITPLNQSNLNHMDEGIYEAHELLDALFNSVYPVGSYYETTDGEFDPNVAFSGTWVKEQEGLVHVSAGATYVVSDNDQDGGAESISLMGRHIPQHSHQYQKASDKTEPVTMYTRSAGSGSGGAFIFSPIAHSHNITLSAQATTTFGNNPVTPVPLMQPYKNVYRWHRTE